jgi:hypothetical protein
VQHENVGWLKTSQVNRNDGVLAPHRQLRRGSTFSDHYASRGLRLGQRPMGTHPADQAQPEHPPAATVLRAAAGATPAADSPHPAPSSRHAPAPGQDTEAVLDRPGNPGRTGSAAASRPSSPAAPDHLPANPAAMARRPGSSAVGIPTARSGTAAHGAGDTRPDPGDGAGQPRLGDTGASRAPFHTPGPTIPLSLLARVRRETQM